MAESGGTSGSDAARPSRYLLSDPAFVRRIGITLILLALYRVGSLVPAPGIDPQVVFGDDAASTQLLSSLSGRLSYFALQLTPLFSVLLLAEVFKLAFADVRDWINDSARTRYLFNKIVLVATLLLSTLQAWGVTVGLEALHDSMPGSSPLIIEPGATFRLVHVSGIVAGTALSIWLADQITRHGAGSGFWMLFLLPSVSALAFAPAVLAPHIATDDVRFDATIALALVLCAAAAAIAVLARQWQPIAEAAAESGDATGRCSNVMSILVWPPFIATSVLGMISSFLNFFGSFVVEGESKLLENGSLGFVLWLAGFITLLTYMSANAMLEPKTRTLPVTQRLIALTAAAAVIICVAIDALVAHFVPVHIGGPSWIAIVTVLVLIIPRGLRAIGSSAGSDAAAS